MNMAPNEIRCRLSDPSQPHYLSEKRDGPPPFDCFTCEQRDSKYNNWYLYCEVCDVYFHENECYEYPRKMRHPYHPQHPLSFTLLDDSGAFVRNSNVVDCNNRYGCWRHESDTYHGECDWCGEYLSTTWFYRCSICGYTLDSGCSGLDPPLNIANPKNHEHDLILLHRPFLTPCDACGSVDASDPAYACLKCNYFVHRNCVDLPRAIKITYHRHRLWHTTHLRPGKWSCGICHKQVDNKYGAYSCTEGCTSFFHSKCVTRSVIWDLEEREWEPEEPDETEDPFEKVGEKEILHFSHQHHLRLNEGGDACDADKQCQTCVLPVCSGDFYSCVECEFFLHIACASLPRKKYLELHHHPLILSPLPLPDHLWCKACSRISVGGFHYKCHECMYFSDKVDVRCASVSSPLNHRSHQHPLHFFYKEIEKELSCEGCHKNLSFANCLECIDGCCFALCFRCATFPNEVCYKDDEHLLSLCCGEDSKDKYWCEVCEREFNPKDEWFYTCYECCVTLHVDCAFGSLVYMKHGHSFEFRGFELQVVRNDSSIRPICSECGQHCRDTVFLKTKATDEYCCSQKCLQEKFEFLSMFAKAIQAAV